MFNMHSRFRPLSLQIHRFSRFQSSVGNTSDQFISPKNPLISVPIHRNLHYHHQISRGIFANNENPSNSPLQNPPTNPSDDHQALKIQTLLKTHSGEPTEEIERRLDECNLSLSDDSILNMLERHRSDWKPSYAFFSWVRRTKNSTGFAPNTPIYNKILDTLGRMKRFQELHQVLVEMSSRKNLIDERTYGVVLNRFSAAHKVDESIELFNNIQSLGLERNLVAFQTLLLSLCRYKHVEAAEKLFRNTKSEFEEDIKTWNIILNGWCVLRSLPDAKRFWMDILKSDCKPDKFTYGIFINALSKSGKISTASKVLRKMWEKDCTPDAPICNTVIEGLCYKKQIPEALKIFSEMNQKGCPPNAATYNSLIKHLCKIQRMEKVYELLNSMDEKGETCSPNAVTYGYLLKAAKNPKEVDTILERMKKKGCKLEADTYNLALRLFTEWGDEERVKYFWDEMERNGLGPDRRSYTIIVHGLYDKGKIANALQYFAEMTEKGMEPESRTKILVDDMNFKLNEAERARETLLIKNKR
ncbi:hypothetical protein ABFS82_13G071500 [Erythranthe guttata]